MPIHAQPATECLCEIEHALGRLGLERRIVLQTLHWGTASDLVTGTDLILIVARRSLKNAENDPRLQIFEPPLAIEPFDFRMIWHPRRDADPGLGWLRQMIVQVCASEC